MSGGYQKIAADEEHSEAQIEENSKTTTEKLSVSLHDTLFEIDYFKWTFRLSCTYNHYSSDNSYHAKKFQESLKEGWQAFLDVSPHLFANPFVIMSRPIISSSPKSKENDKT